MSRVVSDRRGVSVTVGYVLMLAVAALLLGTLLAGASGLVEDESEQVIDDELTVIGNQLASNIHEADRLAQVAAADANATTTGTTGSLSLDVRLPQRVAGTGYLIEIGSDNITLLSSNPDVSVTVPYPETAVPVSPPDQLSGGDLRISYRTSDGRLVIDQ